MMSHKEINRMARMKETSAMTFLCYRKIPAIPKDKFYRAVLRPAILHRIKYWAFKAQYIYNMKVV